MNAENGRVAHEPVFFFGGERKCEMRKNLDLNIFVYSSGENRFMNATLKRNEETVGRASAVFDGSKWQSFEQEIGRQKRDARKTSKRIKTWIL